MPFSGVLHLHPPFIETTAHHTRREHNNNQPMPHSKRNKPVSFVLQTAQVKQKPCDLNRVAWIKHTPSWCGVLDSVDSMSLGMV